MIFDFIFDGLLAWQTLGLFFLSFVFILIGVGVLFYELYWKITGRRIVAKIKELRKLGGSYYVVYEYLLPNGQVHAHTSSVGHGDVGKNIPGRKVSILVSRSDAFKMKRPSVFLFILGVIFLCPGLFILHQAVQAFEFNYMMLVIPLVLFAFVSFKIMRAIAGFSDTDRAGMSEAFRELRKNGFKPEISSGKQAKNAEVFSHDDLRKRLRVKVKSYIVGGYACFFLGVGFLIGGYYSGMHIIDKIQNGVPASGVVTGFDHKRSGSAGTGDLLYYSLVSFKDASGSIVKFRDSHGSSHRMYKRGDKVDVLYDPRDPEDAIIDRGVLNWLISGVLFVFGILLFLASYDNFFTVRLYRRYI